jgi:hypothetical protein
MSATIRQPETPNVHVEAWFSPEDTATISVSMAGAPLRDAPLNVAWLIETLTKATEEARAMGKTHARIFINHVQL